MDQNDVRDFCEEFVRLSAFDGIREIAPSVFALDPSPENLVATMDAYAKTVLEMYIFSLCESLAEGLQFGDLADQLFRGVN